MTENTPQGPDEVTGTIARLIRRASSVEGNPAYTVVLTSGHRLKTATNAGVSYEIANSDYENVPVIFTLSTHGSVIGIRLA